MKKHKIFKTIILLFVLITLKITLSSGSCSSSGNDDTQALPACVKYYSPSYLNCGFPSTGFHINFIEGAQNPGPNYSFKVNVESTDGTFTREYKIGYGAQTLIQCNAGSDVDKVTLRYPSNKAFRVVLVAQAGCASCGAASGRAHAWTASESFPAGYNLAAGITLNAPTYYGNNTFCLQ